MKLSEHGALPKDKKSAREYGRVREQHGVMQIWLP